MRQRRLSLLDKLITEADSVMRTITNRGNQASRPSPSCLLYTSDAADDN